MIGFTLNFGEPVVVADIVAAGNYDTAVIPAPPLGEKKYLKCKDYEPFGFVQKTYIIKNNLCIALAGTADEMKDFLFAFTSYLAGYEEVITQSHVIDFLHKYPKRKFNQAAVVVLLIEYEAGVPTGTRRLALPSESFKEVQSNYFDLTSAAGPGKERLLAKVAAAPGFTGHAEGSVQRTMQRNISLFAQLLAEDKMSGDTTPGIFGAGFEAIFFNGHSFVKLDKVAYIICTCAVDEHGKIALPVPKAVMYYEYAGDILFIRSIEIGKSKNEITAAGLILSAMPADYTIDLFDIAPVNDQPDCPGYSRPANLSFFSSHIALTYALVTQNGSISYSSVYSPLTGISVKYTDGEGIAITLKPEVSQRIIDGAKEFG